MPTVPETFAPSVTQGDMPMTPATGPWVSPMRNSAPSLLAQTGQTVMQGGSELAHLGNTIGDTVQQTMDAAQTKAAETSFLKSSQDILTNPQGGYLNSRGMDAQTRWDPTSQALAKARQDARATLTNPIQQRAFDLATNDHMLAIGQQMNEHQHQQVTQYAIQQSQDRADSMSILARDAYLGGRQADYQKYAGQVMNEVLGVAQLNGAAPDSDVAQAMLRAKRTELVQGVTVGLLDNHQYDEAKQYFEQEKGNIDMRAADTLGNAVKSEYDRNLTETKGDAFLAAAQNGGSVPHTYGPLATGSTINPMRITDVPGTPRPDGRTHDGYDIAMPQGTAVTAPLDGKVQKVWDDDKFGGGLSMRVQLADGNTLGIAHLSAANLNEGDSVNRGQVIALSGKTGNATGGVLHVALEDPDGKHIDYFGASQAQPDTAGMADPDVLQKAIDMAKGDSSLDPFQQRQVIRYMESEHSKERAIQEQQYQQVKQQAVDTLLQNGGNFGALPADLRTQLRPSDALEFQQRALGITEEQQRQAQVPVLANWYQNPQQMTESNVNEAYAKGQLTPEAYLRSLEQARAIAMDPNKVDPQKVIDVGVENDQIENTLLKNGRGDLVNAKPGTPQQAQKVALWEEIKDQVDSEQQAANRKLTRDQKQSIIDSTILNSRFLNVPGWFGSQTATAPWEMTPQAAAKAQYTTSTGKTVPYAPIPGAARMAAVQSLIQRRLPISERNIYDTWVNAGMVGAKQ